MKKTILSIVSVLFLSMTSCSSDNNSTEAENSVISSARPGPNPVSCMSGFTINCTLVPATSTSNPKPLFSWDTSEAAYNANTTTSIEIRPSNSCNFTTDLGAVQVYPISNFFVPATNSMALSFSTIGSRCFKWRLVNQGTTVNGASCLTTTAWQNFSGL